MLLTRDAADLTCCPTPLRASQRGPSAVASGPPTRSCDPPARSIAESQRIADAHSAIVLQGANPFSDIGCRQVNMIPSRLFVTLCCSQALEICGKYLVRAANDDKDVEARHQMMLAAVLAGIAFGTRLQLRVERSTLAARAQATQGATCRTHSHTASAGWR
jgi:hypothetical protein